VTEPPGVPRPQLVDGPPPTLGYASPTACGTVSVYREGRRVQIVAVPEPLGWRTVVRRTLNWIAAVTLTSFAIAAAVSVNGGAVFCWFIAIGGLRWIWGLWTIHRNRRKLPPHLHYSAGPDGVTWLSRHRLQPCLIPAEAIAAVRLRVSPRADLRTHPVSVLLVQRDGQEHMIGQGTLEEGELIAASIEEGIGLRSPPSVAAE
jgi:hypothetical protein